MNSVGGILILILVFVIGYFIGNKCGGSDNDLGGLKESNTDIPLEEVSPELSDSKNQACIPVGDGSNCWRGESDSEEKKEDVINKSDHGIELKKEKKDVINESDHRIELKKEKKAGSCQNIGLSNNCWRRNKKDISCCDECDCDNKE